MSGLIEIFIRLFQCIPNVLLAFITIISFIIVVHVFTFMSFQPCSIPSWLSYYVTTERCCHHLCKCFHVVMLGYAWQKVDKILFRRIFVILRAEARKDLKIGRLHFFLNIIIRGLDIISATMRSAESGRGQYQCSVLFARNTRDTELRGYWAALLHCKQIQEWLGVPTHNIPRFDQGVFCFVW